MVQHSYFYNNVDNSSQQQQDASLAFDLLAHVNNNNMTDVVLVSADGHQVPASRFVLGARSPILQQQLFAKEKSSQTTTCLPYSGTVVRAMVEFCRTNDIVAYARTATRDLACLRQVIHLCDCAHAYKLPGLQELSCNLVTSVLWQLHGVCSANFSWACAVLDEAVAKGGASVLPIQRLAMDAIRSNPQAALLEQTQEFQLPGVLLFGEVALQLVLADDKMNCEEIVLFQSLVVWTNNHHTNRFRDKKRRREIAKKLVVSSIDLSRIAPSDLCGIVSESGLVPPAAIWNALKETALRTEHNPDLPISRLRNNNHGLIQANVINGVDSPLNHRNSPPSIQTGTTTAALRGTQAGLDRYPVLSAESESQSVVVTPPHHSPPPSQHRQVKPNDVSGSSDNESTAVASEMSSSGFYQHASSVASHKSSSSSRQRSSNNKRTIPRDPPNAVLEEDDASILAGEIIQTPKRRERRPAVKHTKKDVEQQQQSPGPVKGNLMTLAEKLDSLCVCGSGEDPSTLYQ